MRSRLFQLLSRCYRTLRYRIPLKYYIWMILTIALILICQSCFSFIGVTVWKPSTKLLSTPERGFRFGKDIAADGDTLVASISTEDVKEQVLAYVYTRKGSQWRERAVLSSPDLQKYEFMHSMIDVDISGDTIAVSIPGIQRNNISTVESNGFIYIFEREGTDWVQRTRITPKANVYSISLDGDTLVTSGTTFSQSLPKGVDGGVDVYLHNLVKGSWSFQSRIKVSQDLCSPDFFSFRSIDVSGDIIVGSNRGSGYACVYVKDPQLQTLV